MSTTRHHGLVVRVLLALVLMVTMTACGGSDKKPPPAKNTLPTAKATPTPPPVTASGAGEGTKIEVTGSNPGIDPGAGLTFVSPVYSLSPSGPLGGRTTLTLQLDNALPARSTVLVATRESPADTWSYLPARLTSDGRHVTFVTTHLSDVGAIALDLSGVYTAFKDSVRAGLVTGIDRKVAKPECTAGADARKDGYSVASWKRKTLSWCLDRVKDQRVLKIVNRRVTPVQVAHTDAAPVTTASKTRGLWTTWAGVLTPGSKDTFLAPGGTATYDVSIDPEKLVLISSESDAVSQSLRALQAGVRALVAQLAQFGVTAKKYPEVFKALVARPQCARTLGKGSDALIAGCFSRSKMLATFGNSGQLLVPLVSVKALKVFLGKQFKALAVQDQSEITQHIVVRRAKPDFGALVGFWAGPDHRVLRITKDGVVTEHYSNADGKVIDITYQLSLPETADNGTTTATSVVTGIKVYNRKAIGGRVPKRGDTGTISGDGSVVRPPALGTSYCDTKSLKKGTCGKPGKPTPKPPNKP